MQVEKKSYEEMQEEIAGLQRRLAALENTEGRLRRLESDLDLSFRLSPMLMCLLGVDGTVHRVNPVFHETCGWSTDELLKRPYWELLHPDDVGAMIAIVGQLAKGKPFFNAQMRLLRPDASVRTILWTGIPLADVGLALCIGQDITEQRKAEQAAAASEGKYRRLYQGMMDAFASVDMQGFIREHNEPYRAMLGYTLEEIATLRYQDVTPARWHAFEEDIVRRQVLVRGYSDTYEKEYRRKDGTVFPVELRTFLITDDAGQPSGMWAIVRDITERKRAEAALWQAHEDLERRVAERTAELTRANEALRRSEERFRVAFEEAPMGVLIAVGDGLITRVNRALCTITGLSPEELTSCTLSDLTHPADWKRRGPMVQDLLAGKIPSVTWEGRCLARGGREFWARTTAAAVRLPSGEMVFALVIVEDITQRKQAQDALERERKTLERMLRASDHERQLIAYEIHDGLAQQLAAAIMQFQIHEHLHDKQPDEAAAAYLAGTTMVRQSHFETRRLISGVRPPVLDEAGVVEAIAHLAHEQRRSTSAQIDVLARVAFDRLAPVLENTIYRIVQEALTNACRHSQSGQVRIALTQRGPQLRIEVRDWGVGFDPREIHAQHFGLEGIRERARLLGGRSRIESASGKGTRIVVDLPVLPRENDEASES